MQTKYKASQKSLFLTMIALFVFGCVPSAKTAVDVTKEVECVYECVATEEAKTPPPSVPQVAQRCALACGVETEQLVVDLIGLRNKAATRKLAASPCASGSSSSTEGGK